jgi:hypothetical protein
MVPMPKTSSTGSMSTWVNPRGGRLGPATGLDWALAKLSPKNANKLTRRRTRPSSPVDVVISPEALARLDRGRIAYVKLIRSEEVSLLFPEVPEIGPGFSLFALLAADGTPIMITNTREAAIASAMDNQLELVSLH